MWWTGAWRRSNRASRVAILRPLLATAGTNFALAALGLLTGVLVARLLGPRGRGELTAIQTWPSVIATASMLGLPDALVYFSAREPRRVGSRLGSAMLLGLLTSTIVGGLAYVAMPTLLAAQSTGVVAAARWFLLLGPIYALVGMPFHPLQGRADFRAWNTLRITPAVGWLVVLIAAWWMDQRRPEFVAEAYLVFLGLLFIPVITVATARLGGGLWPDVGEWRPLLRFGLPSALTGVSQLVGQRLDQLAIAAFLPAPVLGLYAVSLAWGGAAGPVFGAVSAVFFPLVAGSPDREAQIERVVAGTQAAVLLSLPVGALLFALAPLAIPLLFGDAFRDATPVAMVMAGAGTVTGVNGVIGNGLRGSGEPALVMKAEWTGLVVLFVLVAAFLRSFGIAGVAVALLCANVVVFGVLLFRVSRLTDRRPRVLLLPSFKAVRLLAAASQGSLGTVTLR
jgi:O-antigen/teichoic acid export membrane protein